MNDKTRKGTRFSLVCFTCDAGDHIDNREQAIAEGWTEIEYGPDLPMAYYVGVCPHCRQAEQVRRQQRRQADD